MEAEFLQVMGADKQSSDGSWPITINVNQIMAENLGQSSPGSAAPSAVLTPNFVTMKNVNNKLGYQINYSSRTGGGSVVDIDFPEYIGDSSWDNRYIVRVQVTKVSSANAKLGIISGISTNVDVLRDQLLTYTNSGNMLNGYAGPLYRESLYELQESDRNFASFIIKVDTSAVSKIWKHRIEFFDYGVEATKILAVGIYISRYNDIGYTFESNYTGDSGTRTYNSGDAQVW